MLSYRANPKKKDALDRALGKTRASNVHQSKSPSSPVTMPRQSFGLRHIYWGKGNRVRFAGYDHIKLTELQVRYDRCQAELDRLSTLVALPWAQKRITALQEEQEKIRGAKDWENPPIIT